MPIRDLPLLGADTTAPSSYDSVSDIKAVYRDPRFRSDLREYYASKGIGSNETDEDLIDRFFSDGNWRDLNTLGAVEALSETSTQSDRMKLVTARLQQVWDRQPAFYQEGGRGLAAVPDIAKALILDPVNLIGGGGGLVQGGKAARAAYAAGKGVSEAVGAGMRAGALRGAAIEGGINAAQEAVVDTALQQRNVDLGLQDEVSQTQTAIGAGAGALIGGGLGGLMGGLGGRAAAGQAVGQAEELVARGLTRPDIGTMAPADLDAAQATVGPLQSPARAAEAAAAKAEADRLAAEAAKAAQTASADDLEVKYAGHLAAIDRAIEEHRKVLDDYTSSGFDKLSDADPNKAVYQQQLADQDEVVSLRDTLAKLKAEEEEIRALQGSNVLADDKTAMQRRMLFEERFSKFRNALEQYREPDQINADILQRAEEIRARRNAELDAQAAKDAPKPAKAKVDPQGAKAAPQPAPAQQAAAAPSEAAPAATAAEPPKSPADATQAGEAAAASPPPSPGAAAAPNAADFTVAPDGTATKAATAEAPAARPDGITIRDSARERMADPDMSVDEADFIDWYKNGAPGWANKDKVKTPNTITRGAVGAYKRAVRDGQWVGNAVPKTPEEQPNRLAALLSADDPYSTNFRTEVEELVNDTARFTAGMDDPKAFRQVFEALSTDEKFKSKREDFMRFLDESFKTHGISADAVEANAQEGIAFMMTNAIRKRLADIGYSAEEIRNIEPAKAQRILKEADNREALMAKGWTKSQVEEMNPAKIRELLADTGETTTTPATGPKVTAPDEAFQVTPEDRAKLNEVGYADETIDRMDPKFIKKILSGETEFRQKPVNRVIDQEAQQAEETVSQRQNLRENIKELTKNYQSQGMAPEEARAAAQQKAAENANIGEAPLPRTASGEAIQPGKFQNQRDRQTTQTAIRREGIFETAGRNWNNNRIADMLKMGIATKRIPTTEQYWQTRGDTFVSESIGTMGLKRGEDKFLDRRKFDLTSARLISAETIKANKNAEKYAKDVSSWNTRFIERVDELLFTRSITDLMAGDAPSRTDGKRAAPGQLFAEQVRRKIQDTGGAMTDAEARAAIRDELIMSRAAGANGDPTQLSKLASDLRLKIQERADVALEYAMTADKPNVDGMAEKLGVTIPPPAPRGADDAAKEAANAARKEDANFAAVNQILSAAKKVAKYQKLSEAGGRETAIPYNVDFKHYVIKNGQRVEVTSGVAWYDAYSMRSFASLEEAIAHRNGAVPITEADKRSYLAQFMEGFKSTGNIKALRENLEKLSVGDFTFLKRTPAGVVNVGGQKMYAIIARKDDVTKRSVRPRKVTMQQYDAGGDELLKILGNSDISEFEVRFTANPERLKSDAQAWKIWDKAIPDNKLDTVGTVYANRASLNPTSYETYSKKRVTSLSEEEADAIVAASQISIGKIRLPYDSAEQVMAAAKAGNLPMHDIEMAENALAYFAPISSNREGMLGIAKQMAALNRIREREAPMGFVLPAVKRDESIVQLRGILSGYDRNTVVQMETMLRRLNGGPAHSPIFKQLADAAVAANKVGGYTWADAGPNPLVAMPQNSISMASGSQIAQANRMRQLAGKEKFGDFVGGKSHPVATLAHELFHWSWRNILNPSDRIEFVEALARQLYDKDGNALPIADQLPPLANALHSINEVGANLFSQWFLRNRSDRIVMGEPDVTPGSGLDNSRLDKWLSGLDKVFTKFKDHILGIIDRYFHNIPLDPALELKFSKILPDDRMLAFRDGRGPPPETFGPKAAMAAKIDQRYKEFRLVRRDLEEALTVGENPESILRAAIGVSNYLRSIAVNRQPGTAASGIFQPIRPWYKILHERNKELTFMITGRRLDDSAVDNIDKILTSDGKPKIAKDMPDAEVGDYKPLSQDDPDYLNADEIISKGPRVKEARPTMADKVGAMDPNTMKNMAQAIRELYFEGNPIFRPGAAPAEKYSLKYALDRVASQFEKTHIDLFGTLPKSAAPNIIGEIEEAISPSAATRVERSAKVADAQFGNTMADILDARNFDYKAAGEIDINALGNIREQSVVQMSREWPRVKGTPRGVEIMAEVKRRLKAEPFPPERVKVPKAMADMKTEPLNDALFTALREGGPENAKIVSQAAHEIHRRAANELRSKNNLPKINAITADAREAISREIEDNEGVSSQIGIPANARATVREALSYVTDRNPEHAYAARTMLYRLYNLMGKTVRATVEDSNLMSMAELARLAGVEPGAGATGMVVDFKSPVFKSMRRDIRRFAIGLNKQTSTPIDLMHEIGHVIIRGVLPDSDRASVLEFYRAAKNEIKERVQNTYGPKYAGLSPAAREERLAHEWFAESWAQWAAERVVRGDIQKMADTGKMTNISLRGKIDTLIDRLTEFVAYVVNGLIGRDDIKQMFRRLTYYGDMFDVRKPANVADVYGDNFAVPSHIAADYVDESLFRNKARLERMQDFVRGTEGEDANGNPVLLYHGSPAGYKLRKADNPDVVLRPSYSGKLGPGTYVTFNPVAAERAYAQGTPRSINAMIEDADLDPSVADDMLDLVDELQIVRSQIRGNVGELTLLRSETDKVSDQIEGDANAFLLRDDANRIENTLSAYYRREKAILDTLQRNGISPDGVVLPLVTNAKRLANFSEKMRYQPDDPFVTALVDKVQSYFPKGTIDSANAYATFTSLGSVLTGRTLYDRLITMATKNGISPSQAKVVVQNGLRELGYDGIRATFVDKVTREGMAEEINHEGAVIFDTAKLKHVDADEFDPADDRLYLRALSDTPVAPMGRIVGSIIEGNTDGFNSAVIADAMEAAEAAGVAPRFIDTIRSMAGRRNLTPDEFRTKANAATVLLGSQSKRMAQDRMKWLADRYQDFFPSVSVEFAKHFYPVLNVLRSLPGTDSEAGRWMKRSFGTLPGAGKRLGKQPAAYARIVAALRRGNGSKEWADLSGQEKVAAQAIRDTFTSLRDMLIKSGDSIGKRENYFPQIWNAEKIAANRSAFIDAAMRYFEMERIAEGGEVNPEEITAMAEKIAMKLTDEDADRYFPPQIRSSNAKAEHLDYSRIFQLEKYPGFLKDFEPFLENDLEAIVTKYIDGAARRLVQNDRFGNSTHMFNDYMLAATEGVDGIAQLLSTPKVYRKEFRALEGGEMKNAMFELEVGMPFQGREDLAKQFAEGLVQTFQTTGRAGAEKALMELSKTAPKTYVRRVDAILGALEDFGGKAGLIDPGAVERAQQSMKLLVGQPLTNPSMGGRFAHKVSKNLRAFNSITLLSFATLTSLTDIALPIIRSGEFRAWYQGLKQMAQDPEYRQLIRNVGVAIESEVHQHLSTLYGEHTSKHANAFFNATMLTPWTNVQRKIAAATGFEAMKVMQQKAFRTFKEGVDISKQPAEYRTAHRFLTRYGLQDYLPNGSKKNISLDQQLLGEDDGFKRAVVKFTDEAIFSPNPNDIPLWAQTPLGSIIFQFKAYPLMMGRMARWALEEASRGNYKPVAYMTTIAPGLGAATLAIKDVVQMRGGEDNDKAQIRSRNLQKFLGYDEKVHGDANDFMGWYMESMLATGGFGFLAEMLHDVSSQVDNGAYGKTRIYGTIGGPSVGTVSSAIDIAAGAQAALGFGDSTSNYKERSAVREAVRRVPVLGGISSVREGATNAIAGPRAERSTGGWNSDWKGWE